MPLQLLLRSIVSNMQFLTGENASRIIGAVRLPSEGIKYAATIVTIGPILFLYPFAQKYFVKGLMVGAIKG
jgi:putative aldouronate transport system permease protein